MPTEDDVYQQIINQCEEHLRHGNTNKIADHFHEIIISKIPHKYKLSLSQICRRSGLFEIGLKILGTVVRPKVQLEDEATAEEISEYAVLLSTNGSTDEALSLLHDLDGNELPEVHLNRGFCEVINWNLSGAADHFSKFLLVNEDPYKNLVALVNLASCRVFELKFDSALELIDQCIAKAGSINAQRLLANCYELQGQTLLRLQKYDQCQKSLDAAAKILGQQGNIEELFIKKWKAIFVALKSSETQPLREFRQLAFEHKHWDSIREADLFLSKVEFNQKIFDHLYFGTRFPKYRERILREINTEPSPFIHFGDSNFDNYFDLSKGVFNKGTGINAGKKIHRLLEVMCKDFYSPIKLGYLFSELYPDEHFNAESTPFRVRQLVNRFRNWAEENSVPADLVFEDSGYRLRCRANFSIKIEHELNTLEPYEVLWRQFCHKIGPSKHFSSRDGQALMKMPRATFSKFIAWAVSINRVQRVGAGRSTSYVFSNDDSRKKVA